MHSTPAIALPQNEPILSYAPGTPERAALKTELQAQAEQVVEDAAGERVRRDEWRLAE